MTYTLTPTGLQVTGTLSYDDYAAAWLEATGRGESATWGKADYVKLNLATAGGWRVLRFTSNMLDDDPVGVVEQVARLVCGEREQ